MVRLTCRRLVLVFPSILLAVLWWYSEDIRELPDRWHAPFFNPEPASTLQSPYQIFLGRKISEPHPVDHLYERARKSWGELLTKQTNNLSASAAAYRERRGRHPPPGFDQWVEYALAHDCVIIEDFFDQIYRDIEPFWALPAREIRETSASTTNLIRVRDGKATKLAGDTDFLDTYYDMLQRLESYLPDLDMPINAMDEPRILLSWEDVNKLMVASVETRGFGAPHYTNSFKPLSDEERTDLSHAWIREGPYWKLARSACHPDAVARSSELDTDFSTPPEFPQEWPNGSYRGYVSNWTVTKDPCAHPHLRNMHGSFVEPISQSTSMKLLPMFSGSKLPFNNDILLPGAVYWHGDQRFSTRHAEIPWSKKRTEVLWRGSASGGRNTVKNWTRFQRHRLVSMLNGTQIEATLTSQSNTSNLNLDSSTTATPYLPHNFPLPNSTLYPLHSTSQNLLPSWIRHISNVAFTWLVCFPATKTYPCPYTIPYYRRGTTLPLHRMFHAKYLPDVDGNSFSGRYLSFLRSTSLPLKATIYAEWHDDRLAPWIHFVPLDNTFVDLWSVLEYLVRRDEVGERIAGEGSEWAAKVLRRKDMLVYVWRLLIEFARVSRDERAELGWVGDL